MSSASGQEVPLEEPGSESTYSVGGRSGRAVLVFDVTEPGLYQVSGSYESGAGPATVIAVGHDFNRKLLMTIVGAIGIALIGLLLALTIAVVTFVRRRRARNSTLARPDGTAYPSSPPDQVVG